MKSFIFCERQKQISDPQTTKYKYEYGFTFTFIFIRTFIMLPSPTQLPSASNIRIPQYTIHTTHHNLLLQDWFKYSVDVHSRNTSMSDRNKITSSLSANMAQMTLQETEVRGKRLSSIDMKEKCYEIIRSNCASSIWWEQITRLFIATSNNHW